LTRCAQGWDSDLDEGLAAAAQMQPSPRQPGKKQARAKQPPPPAAGADDDQPAPEKERSRKRRKTLAAAAAAAAAGGAGEGAGPRMSTAIQLLDPKAALLPSAVGASGQRPAGGGGSAGQGVPPALQGFAPLIQKAMSGLGFSEPTPVQAACWPAASAGESMQVRGAVVHRGWGAGGGGGTLFWCVWGPLWPGARHRTLGASSDM
jgi:hypothetical protein